MTIKRVESYQANDGTLHLNIQSAVGVNLTHIINSAVNEFGSEENPTIAELVSVLITQPYRARIIQQLQELT